MRRIDLTCKLIGPLFIALIDGMSTEAAILVNLGMNVVSVAVEYFAIAQVSPTRGIFSLLDVILKLPFSGLLRGSRTTTVKDKSTRRIAWQSRT